MIELLLSRLSLAKEVERIVVATSVDARNQPLIEHICKLGYTCERGSEDDVLDRFVRAARRHQADVVVRITGDCPLVDPWLVDETIRRFKSAKVDYYSNLVPFTYPDGLDIEICTFKALEKASCEAYKPFDREHVTSYLRETGRFTTAAMQHSRDLSALRWTVDEPVDFFVIEKVFQHFHPRINFAWEEVFNLYCQSPDVFNINQHLSRNEGATRGIG